MDLDSLLAKAEAAAKTSPGPWTVEWSTGSGWRDNAKPHERPVEFINDANGDHVVVADSGIYPPEGYVAEHIAACSPEAIAALVRVAKAALEWDKEKLIDALDALTKGQP